MLVLRSIKSEKQHPFYSTPYAEPTQTKAKTDERRSRGNARAVRAGTARRWAASVVPLLRGSSAPVFSSSHDGLVDDLDRWLTCVR